MLFVSAQPDNYYFLWQLELQLYNLYQLGVPKDKIHVLIGYQPEKGVNVEFQTFSRENPFARFFFYPDQRVGKEYLSSIRPHLLKQHYETYPDLKTKTIFYHDSDILFHSLPDFQRFDKGKEWFVSDTKKYIGSSYIERTTEENIFNKMCEIVGIASDLVKKNDPNAGGAQYIIKEVDYLFWDKVERDSEKMYKCLSHHNHIEAEKYHKETGKPISRYHGIQAWCADMWALLWNAWLYGHHVKIDKDLDFCWPYNKYSDFGKKKILHYTGSMNLENKKLFAKTRYINYPPYYDDDLEQIDKDRCSYVVKQKIDSLLEYKRQKRFDLRDVSFLIPVDIDSEKKEKGVLSVIKYIYKYFDTHIILIEKSNKKRVRPGILPDNVRYIKKSSTEDWIRKCETPILSLYDINTVLPVEQIVAAADVLRKKQTDCVIPFNDSFLSVDQLFKEIFGRLLDPEVLQMNKGKFNHSAKQANGKSLFMKKKEFFKMNAEKELLDKELDILEWIKIQGYSMTHITGHAFRLWSF